MRDIDPFESEDAWTARLRAMLPNRPGVRVGIGDDAAVVASPGADRDLVYTSDAVIESIHFAPGTEPGRIGHKMAGRLLSDLAAMGAAPAHVLLNLVAPEGVSAGFLESLYRGVSAMLDRYKCALVGGDTARGAPLALHGFAAGHLPAGTALLRSGARPGHVIFVTGELGGSSGGRHLDFEPRVAEGIWLREQGWASAMMDLSDGLARDLPRMCRASGTGAQLEEAHIPTRVGVERALSEGEDYELLFTVPGDRREAFISAWRKFSRIPCTAIGVMSAEVDVIRLRGQNGLCRIMAEKGFDHFS